MHADGLAHPGIARACAAEAAAALDEHAVAQHDVSRAADHGGSGGAVIAAVNPRVQGGQGLGCDVDGDATGAGHAVVGRVHAAQGQARDGHGLVAAHVLVGQCAGGQPCGWRGDGHHVTSDQVAGVGRDGAGGADIDGDGGGAVIGAVNGAHTGQTHDAQWARRDAGGGAGAGRAQAVVQRVGARQRNVGDGHGLAGAHILGPDAGEVGGLQQRHRVADDGATDRGRDRRHGGAVINARAASVGSGHRFGRDGGGGGAGGAAQAVVGCVSPAQLPGGDADGFAHTGVLAGREDARAADGDVVACHHVSGTAQHVGHRGAVVDPIDTGVGRAQQLLRDVDGDAVGGRHAVVQCVGAGQRQAVHHQGLVVAGVLVDQRACGQTRDGGQHADHVASHDVGRVDRDGTAAADGDADVAGAVVNPVGRGDTGQPGEGDGLGRDAAGGGGVAGCQVVVVGVGALQADAADLDGLAGTDVLGARPGEDGGARQRDAVADDKIAHGAGHCRVGGAVVDAAASGVGGRHLAACDIGRRAAAGVEQGVVAGVCTRQAGGDDGQRLVAALVLGARAGEVAAAPDEQAVAGNQVGRGARDGGRRGAVVDAVDAAVGGGQGLGRDVDGDTGSACDAVVAGIGARQREAVHAHGLGVAGVLVEHGARGDARDRHIDGHRVARNDVAAVGHQCDAAGHGDGHHGGAVVDAVGGHHIAQATDGDGFAGDAAGGAAGGAARGGAQGVVVRVGARQSHAGDADGFTRAHIARARAGELGALSGGDDVAQDPVRQ